MKKSVRHLKLITKQDDWETPWDVYEKICTDYKVKPMLDVCAAQSNTKCADWFTEAEDGLHRKWLKDVWMNPPYSNVAEWMNYAFMEHLAHNITITCLTFSKTDTKWWHDIIERTKPEIHFIRGRIKFFQPVNGESLPSKHYAPYPSVVIIFRKKP